MHDDNGPDQGAAPPHVERDMYGDPVKQRRPVTVAQLSRDFRIAVATSFRMRGGVEYLNNLPDALFVQLLSKCINNTDAAAGGDIQFVIQQINVNAAPTAGVLSSPVQAHVAQPLRLVSASNADESGGA